MFRQVELAVRQSGRLKTESIEVGKEVWFWERTCEEERRLKEKTGRGGGDRQEGKENRFMPLRGGSGRRSGSGKGDMETQKKAMQA